MSGKITLSKLKPKSSSTPSPLIAFRFNTADEDLEELPYEVQETPVVGGSPSLTLRTVPNSVQSSSGPSSATCKDSKKNAERVLKKESSDTDDEKEELFRISPVNDTVKETEIKSKEGTMPDVIKEEVENVSFLSLPKKLHQDAREPSPVRESVKEYLSKFGKRSTSLDSGPNNTESEGWSLLNELKGRIAKTLEERINKDTVVMGSPIEKNKTMSEGTTPVECKGFFKDVEKYEIYPPDITIQPKSLDDPDELDTSHLSPSIEATEFISDENLFDEYENNEIEGAKCIISSSMGSKTQKSTTVIAPKSQSILSPKRTKTHGKSDICMSLSSLMANRTQSTEEEEDIEEIVEIKSENEPTVLPVDKKDEFVAIEKVLNQHSNMFTKLWWETQNFYKFIKSTWNNVISCIVVISLALALAPFPSYLSGIFMGIVLSSAVFCLLWWLMKPGKQREPFVLPDFSKLPPLTISVSQTDDEPTIYKGWMNELPFEYNPDTYHVNSTHSVYIRLEGSSLRVSYPKTNVPKRAMFNEVRHDPIFVHQRHYDVIGATLTLLPEGLARKRLWSKKYPICLTIPSPKHAIISSSIENRDISSEEIYSSSQSIASKIPSSKESSPIRKTFPKYNDSNGDIVLYLFARTDREKDEWFRRFETASMMKKLKSQSPSSSPNIAAMESSSLENKRAISVDLGTLQLSSSLGSICSIAEEEEKEESPIESKSDRQAQFQFYMASLLSSSSNSEYSHPLLSSTLSRDKKIELTDSKKMKNNCQNQSAQNLLWLNSLIGRLFFDFLTIRDWSKAVSERIQKKLSKIKVPYFMEELTITDINLGTSLPKIHRASDPIIDQRGLWVDLDLSYNGSFQMTLETKLNLLRLKKGQSGEITLAVLAKEKEIVEKPVRSHVYNSEEEDSAESSSDEDVPLPDIEHASEESGNNSPPPTAGGSTSKKLLRLVDKITQSRYFQQATEYKYIKRAIEEVSNTPLVLTVEVHWLTGTLAFNIPPLPTDRLWYGFRKNPQLSIVARPKLGGHEVTITHITEWIEKKLVLEFQKILVMPNMDDLIIPIMDSGMEMQKS